MFKQHRQNFINKLLPNSISILPGADIKYRSNDAEYPFRQDSNFYYLTNFPEPKAVAVLIKGANNNQENKFILFNQKQDQQSKIWDGERIGQQGAIDLFGADEAYSIDEFDVILPKLLANKEIVYYPQQLTRLDNWQANILATIDKLIKSNNSNDSGNFDSSDNSYSSKKTLLTKNLLEIIAELRVIKSAEEIELIRTAAKVSANAHNHLLKYVAANNNINEKQLQAEFYNYCLQHGCDDMAYGPIVAGGSNACILHYTQNNTQLNSGDLVLIDAGAEYNYYAADISRTFPVNGKFSPRQRDLYQLVLLAQQTAIKMIKPGIKWSDLQQVIVKVLVAGLVDLKILTGNIDSLIESGAYKSFYMHGSGHFLGMDVHDCGVYTIDGESRELLPGMVFTVEPGLYFAPGVDTPSEWQGMGIRIEDNIVVTKDSHDVLTEVAVKDIATIEELMGR
jgi:Xaa-Pro aminopeptidase